MSAPRVSEADLAVVAEQLGRPPRGVVEVAARCVCGRPVVVRTAPRLPDGTPFPTTYYLTHPGAHEDYLARRAELGEVPEIEGISAGGMPDRVKCLHVLAAHALARGRGVNVLGDETLDLISDEWRADRCTCRPGPAAARTSD